MFLNSTIDFALRTSPPDEPALPQFPQAYGYNTLLLDSDRAAFLDILQPSYVNSVQSTLAIGET
ncbi:hypothetical protein RRF57_010368 [Xylaria bambusicola]|uniref:Uncharacterized protein n=1 Tax=Xylaria bambusicola TaxID=326684 RepID=A0AAN7Z2N7_9PEZI